ncbi:ROK family transcriptional regulator [Jatrophihabitans lederbergiae]|uniref:ROK family transcriptional regulator n=1 Tax=Jatrophihabitans lederbergiae TaxID=3075547 RepID=A0ABU2J7R4_9ACTN|nr:ROK family transcriptional regulator [Jatrophihabitans sp. DSM 44399]MDT0260664.1 ROK family transcriptional regulator [Jatrophihabitans sp. DSM 44399]
MPGTRTTTVRDLRKSNRARALWELYMNGPLTRQEVGAAAGVSPATVSNLVGELLEQGVVIEVGLEDSNGGRPRGLLQVNPEYGFVVGVDVGETALLVELFDLSMKVRASHVSTTELARLDPQDVVDRVHEGIEAVIAQAGVRSEQILGVGVGVPGLVEHGNDAVVHGQSVGWDAVPLGAMLRDGMDLPLLIDNGAKTLGQAEKWFGAARGSDNAVIVLLGIGVGTSIISNGELYRGSTSSAGEWGHTTVMVEGRQCRCGAVGCLEAYVGAEAIVARYDELKRRRVEIKPRELEERVAAIVTAAPSDKAAAKVLDETATYLGAGIADLVNLFNPERVVVGGWLGQLLGDTLLPRVREVAARHALRLPFSHVSILKAQLGKDAVALGAATLPIASVLSSGAVLPSTTVRSRLLDSSRATG